MNRFFSALTATLKAYVISRRFIENARREQKKKEIIVIIEKRESIAGTDCICLMLF